MKAALVLIEQVIKEHKTLLRRLQNLERITNDAQAIRGFGQVQDNFMPGRLDQKKELNKLEKMADLIDRGLQAHFNREETSVLAAFEEQGDREISSAFSSLLLEHNDLRNRLAHTRNHVAQLTGGQLSRHHWEATAYDMRAHISHTRKLLEAHAEVEQELLLSLRRKLLKEKQA